MRPVGPAVGKVRARLPAKPMNSVSEREPRGGRKEEFGRLAGKVRARLPAKPKNSVSEREPQAGGTQDSFLKKS